MDRIKKERNSKKELLRLKKTLGLLDEDGNDLIKKVEDVVEFKTPEQLKKVKFLLISNHSIEIVYEIQSLMTLYDSL